MWIAQLRHLISRLRRRMRVRAARSELSEHTLDMLLGVVVGALGALSAVGFRWLLESVTELFQSDLAWLLTGLGDYRLVVMAALGGALVGPFVARLRRGIDGSGVPELQEAAARRGGRLRSLCWLYKAAASAVTIGSGGSAGREGPIAFIGASLAADIGKLLRGGERRRRLLLACGAAAGVAATFNAPLAGTLFGLEVILGAWAADTFAPVVGSAVVASAIGRHFFGTDPAFTVFPYELSTFAELWLFALLGLLAAPVAVLFTISLYGITEMWEKLGMPLALRLVPALVVVGLIGTWNQGVLGLGYEVVSHALQGLVPGIGLLLLLMTGKIITTSLTIGSGGSGGIFAPSLFIGAMLGGAVGRTADALLPRLVTTPGAYALVGMGAVFAGVSHAPMTAVLTIFELTGDYRMILPLMLACGVSAIAARHLVRSSIYNLKLLRRGVHVQLGHDVELLNDIEISRAMTTDLTTISPEAPGSEALRLMEVTSHHGFPLVDDRGLLHGMITADDVRRAAEEGRLEEPVSSLGTHELVVAFPHETLNDALRKLGLRHIGRVPVVDPKDHRRILGIITRKDVIAAYNRALVHQHTHLQDTAETELFE